jgi:glycosyltransferase involved in cell wall biosynthesis
MRIAFVSPAYLPCVGWGGPVAYLRDLCRFMTMKGYEVTVYTGDAISTRDFCHSLPRKEFIDGTLVKRYAVIRRVAGEYYLTPSMLKDLKNDEYDIIHANGFRTFQSDIAAYISKRRGISSVITPHGAVGSYLFGKMSFKTRFLNITHNLIGKSVLRYASILIALNRFEIQQYLYFGVEPEKIAVVPNFANPKEFTNPAYDFREKHGIDSDTRIILYAGRLHKIKGLDSLVYAFNLLKMKKVRSVKLVIIGADGGMKMPLIDMCKSYNLENDVLIISEKISVPSREDMISAIMSADVFVSPSLFETFPIVVLEALLCAKPVVATRVGGVPEIIMDGLTGLLVDPKDAKKLAEKILYLLENEGEAKKMGLRGKDYVMRNFTAEVVGEKIANIYCKLLQGESM